MTGHWGLDRTTVCVTAPSFEPLRSRCRPDEDIQPLTENAAELVLEELLRYVPRIRRSDIELPRSWFRPNLRWPSLLNEAGAWRFRPKPRAGIPNLYLAGDYCRTEADLATMESAVQSGLTTARAVLHDQGSTDPVEILDLGTSEGLDPSTQYPRLLLRWLQWGLVLPWALLARGWPAAEGRRSPER